jgi:hypothetical protein
LCRVGRFIPTLLAPCWSLPEGGGFSYSPLKRTFERVASVLRPGGRLLLDVVNLKHDGEVTRLAFDAVDAASAAFEFEGEVVVTWERPGEDPPEGRLGYGYDHSYCDVFRDPD